MTTLAVISLALTLLLAYRLLTRHKCKQKSPDPLCRAAKPCMACYRDGVARVQAGMEKPTMTAPKRRKDILRMRTAKVPKQAPVVIARRA